MKEVSYYIWRPNPSPRRLSSPSRCHVSGRIALGPRPRPTECADANAVSGVIKEYLLSMIAPRLMNRLTINRNPSRAAQGRIQRRRASSLEDCIAEARDDRLPVLPCGAGSGRALLPLLQSGFDADLAAAVADSGSGKPFLRP